MTDDHEMPGKEGRWNHVAMEIADTVNYCTILCKNLRRVQVSFDTDVMVAGKYDQAYPVPKGTENPGQLVVFLAGEGGDAVLDIPEQHQPVGIGLVDDRKQAFEAFPAPAAEMKPVGCEIRLDTEMEVRNNEMPFLLLDEKGGAVTDEFQVHKNLTNPFWG